jgi:hypothetical protein
MSVSKDLQMSPLFLAVLLAVTTQQAGATAETGVRPIERLGAVRSEVKSMAARSQTATNKSETKSEHSNMRFAQWRNV